MKATHVPKLRDFSGGYEMRACAHCGKTTRTKHTDVTLACGATLDAYLCKVCIMRTEIEDTRPHVHVGGAVKVARAYDLQQDSQYYGFRRFIRDIVIDQLTVGIADDRSNAWVAAVDFAIQVCNAPAVEVGQ